MNRLYGLYGTTWIPGEVKQAQCKLLYHPAHSKLFRIFFRKQNIVPSTRCTCGIYGLKDDFIPSVCPKFDVLGVAEIWGKIIVAEKGYRAQYARMCALIDSPYIAEEYGVPNLPSIEYARKEYFE
jgi:hypothetical protein